MHYIRDASKMINDELNQEFWNIESWNQTYNET